MLKVLIADDHEIVIRGMRDLLNDEFDEVLIGEAKNRSELLEKIDSLNWDLILLDIIMPDMNVLDILQTIRQRDSEVRILMLTAMSEEEYAVRTIRAGADGYITKQNASEELVKAIRQVLMGGTYLSSDAVSVLAADVKSTGGELPHLALSQRELEVFCMIAMGRTVKEIAYELSVSGKTVGTYISRIREKTGLENYVDIARYALQNKLVD